MAQIKSSAQPLEISLDGGTVYKTLVCVSTGSLDGSADITTEDTDCGLFTSPGNVSYTLTADAICESSPTATQITYQDLLTPFNNKTQIKVRVQSPVLGAQAIGTVYYHQFSAYVSALNLSKPSASGYISFSVTLVSDGAIDITV